MTLYMMDTGICSFIIRDSPNSVRLIFQKYPMQSICISMVTYAELLYEVERGIGHKQQEAF